MTHLSVLGIIHTVISVVALVAGIWALLRDGAITWGNRLGTVYVVMTVLSCVTGFGIFHHGGFGKPHALGLMTLVFLAIAAGAGRARGRSRVAAYGEPVAYTVTLFFHMIPGLTETFTRLPSGSPLFSGPDDPALQKAIVACLVVFALVALWQVARVRSAGRSRRLAAAVQARS